MSSPFKNTLRIIERDSPISIIWKVLFIGFIFVIWIFWASFSKITIYERSQSARLENVTTIHHITVQASGQVIENSLQIGKSVNEGELLLKIDAADETLKLNELRVRKQSLQTRIESLLQEQIAEEMSLRKAKETAGLSQDEMRAQIESVRADLQFAQDKLKRSEELFQSGHISEVDLQEARLEEKKKRDDLKKISISLNRQEQEWNSKINQHTISLTQLNSRLLELKGDIAAVREQTEQLEQQIDKREIRATLTGKVVEAEDIKIGAMVQEGEKIGVLLAHTEDMRVISHYFPQDAVGRLKHGQHGFFRLYGFPWPQYGSIKTTVLSVASEVRDQTIRVDLSIDSSQDLNVLLEHGLTGTIDVEVEQLTPFELLLRMAGKRFSAPKTGNSETDG